MVSNRLLAIVALGQAASVLVILGYLVVGHRLGQRRDRRRALEGERADEIARRLGTGSVGEDEGVAAFDALMFDTLTRFLRRSSGQRGGPEGDRIAAALRRTRWHRQLQSHTRSWFWWRRFRAAQALTRLAAPADLRTVHQLLSDSIPAVRLAAASTLARLPSPGLADAILEQAAVGHSVVRNHLLEILAYSRTLVVPVLVRKLEQPTSPDRLRALLDLAGLLASAELLSYVVPHTDSSSPEVRVAAAGALRGFPHPGAAAALRRLLRDEEWPVRARAAASLGAIGANEAIDDLCQTLCDRVWWVRLRSAIALRLIGPRGIRALCDFERERDRYGYDMAHYVLKLDDAAMAEYVGGATIDFSGANATAA